MTFFLNNGTPDRHLLLGIPLEGPTVVRSLSFRRPRHGKIMTQFSTSMHVRRDAGRNRYMNNRKLGGGSGGN